MAAGQRPTGLGWPTGEARSADAPRPADTSPPTGEPSPDDRRVLSLSPEDYHALWVNFIGTIASGLVLALIIGGAIALTHVKGDSLLYGLLGGIALVRLLETLFPALPERGKVTRVFAGVSLGIYGLLITLVVQQPFIS